MELCCGNKEISEAADVEIRYFLLVSVSFLKKKKNPTYLRSVHCFKLNKIQKYLTLETQPGFQAAAALTKPPMQNSIQK